MKWIDFEKSIKDKDIKLFTPRDVSVFLGRSTIAVRFLMHRLKQNGQIMGVKRGLYKLSGQLVPDYYLANRIYAPSYISLESALSYYGVIPETVYEITSVTSKITRRFETAGKIFSYHKIKQSAFTGYGIAHQDGANFYLADAEKAFIDVCYLRLLAGRESISRFDKTKLNKEKTLSYADLYKNKKLVATIRKLL
ncbi:MAG: hypothetical protein A3J93_03695 [Candidatus Magasanikbacteria bacterium RIFOXYC2_FULL_42_28]|uniref:AbiEi antitoxin C-terminal domain-containing protein n=1 Tax=Candidatus Magasanikbacteria bacterium RIFOXYC2_FULL_42_28 TaxID=1798704 RepID=A0A1F6NUR0_9BACT|nr:MAG: hypothetical protein A3J93_03695 [Candidatus Magasanikbacteria bacterium RIFOXYC2_FULL_42_28]